jgi:hypothetical protein
MEMKTAEIKNGKTYIVDGMYRQMMAQKATENIFQFPNRQEATEIELEAKEINILPWTNSRYEIINRNRKAKQYINACKRRRESAHEDLWCIISGISVCASIMAAYFLMCCF